MDFDSPRSLWSGGFRGFVDVDALRQSRCAEVPAQPGIYIVLRCSPEPPAFLATSPAGHFRGKDPTVPVEILRTEWVDQALVLYIGQAGGRGSTETLRSRIKSLVDFANGKPIGHWGGRLLWQVQGSNRFHVCWRAGGCGDPVDVEHRMIGDFRIAHNDRRPFGNLRD